MRVLALQAPWRSAIILSAFVGISCPVLAQVEITEFMAVNAVTLADPDGDFSDWIELRNSGPSAVNLAGWSLTDDENDDAKWIFPAVSLASRGYLIVFCSAKDRKPTAPNAKLHTNFKLDADGGYLASGQRCQLVQVWLAKHAGYPVVVYL